MSGDKIMEELWPQMDAKRAADNFHATTYYVRKTISENRLSDIIIYKSGTYALNMKKVQSNLKEFLSSKELEVASKKYYKGMYFDGKDYPWQLKNN